MLKQHSDEAGVGSVSQQPVRPRLESRKRRVTPLSPMPPAETSEEEERLPRIGTLARTRRLLLAALRVWELKHGIRD